MSVTLVVSQVITAVLAAVAAYQAYVARSIFGEYSDSHSRKTEGDDSQNVSPRESIGRWMEMIEAADEKKKTLRLLEAAHQRFPSNQEVVGELADLYREAASPPGDPLVRREATLGFRQAVSRFKSACSPDHFDLALKLEKEGEELADRLADDLENLRREQTEDVLEELEDKVEAFSETESNSEKHLDRIEELDREIDSEVLKRNDDLEERYDQVSTELTERMVGNSDDGTGPDREYNLQAVRSAQEAWEMFQKKRQDWKDKTKETLDKWKERANPFESETLRLTSSKEHQMEEIAYVLGGWDSHRLIPAVNKYISTVHSEIFEQLDREERQIMTEKMIEAPVKE